MAVLSAVLVILVSILTFLYIFSRKKYDYWKKRNVPYLEPATIFGNFKEFILLKVYSPLITKRICEQFPDAPYVGIFYGTEPALVIKDPELLKLVTTKDFYFFNGREICTYTDRETVTQNIFFTHGDRWKVLRQNLTPLFSSLKVKNMFYLVKKCASTFEILLDREVKVSSTLEIRELISRFTIDSITLCGFGIDSNTMGDDNGFNAFKIISKKILQISTFNGIKNMCRSLWPSIFYALGFQMFSPQVTDFFNKLLTEVFEGRNYEPSSRNDFVDLILSLRKNKFITGDSMSSAKSDTRKVNLEVTNDLLISQCVAFFAGGFETTSSALAFTLYELAKHEEIQDLAAAEVDKYFINHKDGIEFDITSELPYLEACIDEALRVYPLLGLTREVMDNYTLPDGLKLEKGLRIHIPIFYLHHNPEYFANPEKYDPERFYGDRRNDIKSHTYMPFGEGGRICIGMRLAKIKMLAGLATILKKYKVKLAEGMPRQVQLEPKSITTRVVGDIRLTFMPRV